MTVKVFILVVAAVFTLSIFVAPKSFAHGGGLDSYGCHNNRKVGNYHCHRGPLAGRTFASQAEMLKELKARGG